MGSFSQEFPFGIMDVVELLHLRIRRRQADNAYTDCPFCGDRRGKMNVNFAKNVWRCNYCGEHGGMLNLYLGSTIPPIPKPTGKSVMPSRQAILPGDTGEQRARMPMQADSRIWESPRRNVPARRRYIRPIS